MKIIPINPEMPKISPINEFLTTLKIIIISSLSLERRCGVICKDSFLQTNFQRSKKFDKGFLNSESFVVMFATVVADLKIGRFMSYCWRISLLVEYIRYHFANCSELYFHKKISCISGDFSSFLILYNYHKAVIIFFSEFDLSIVEYIQKKFNINCMVKCFVIFQTQIHEFGTPGK